jgi:hypothetical protein
MGLRLTRIVALVTFVRSGALVREIGALRAIMFTGIRLSIKITELLGIIELFVL